MGQVSHVAAHAAIVATVLAAVEGLVSGMGADFLKDATQDVVGQTDKLIGPMVFGDSGGVEVVARTGFVLLWGFVTPESLEEAHDAARGTVEKVRRTAAWRSAAAEGRFGGVDVFLCPLFQKVGR